MVTAAPDGVLIDVRVIPRAGRAGLAGTRDDALVVRLGAAPVDGAANAELIDTVADAFGVPRRCVHLVSGDRSRRKRLRIDGLSVERALSVIGG